MSKSETKKQILKEEEIMEDWIFALIAWGIAFLYPVVCAWRATVAEHKYNKAEEGFE